MPCSRCGHEKRLHRATGSCMVILCTCNEFVPEEGAAPSFSTVFTVVSFDPQTRTAQGYDPNGCEVTVQFPPMLPDRFFPSVGQRFPVTVGSALPPEPETETDE